MRRAVTRVGAVALVATAILAGSTPRPGGAETSAERVLIVTLPEVTWADLERVELSNLDRFLEGAAIGDLSTRASRARRATRLGDGYITLGAGTRAIGDGGATDGMGFGVDDVFGPDRAGAVFRRRTGQEVERGVVQLGIAQIVDRNADLLLDAEPGALGDALAAGGWSRAVLANADGTEPEGVPPVFRRQAVSGLMDGAGVVPRGRVDQGLLEEHAASPYGLRYDHDEVLDAFREVWRSRSVVLVEGSDLVRADTYTDFVDDDQGDVLVDSALRRTDELFGALLGEVDLERDAVLVVGPAPPQDELGLAVAALRGPGVEPGLLRSGTTRRSGFVQLIDVAPTVLDLAAVERPSSMSGRPFEVGDRGGDLADRRDLLVSADAAARFVGDRVDTVALVLVGLHAALVGATVLWLSGRLARPRTRTALRFAGLAVLAAVPAVFLARLLAFHDLGALAYWLFLVAASLLLAGLYSLIGRGNDLDALLAAAAGIVVLLAVDVMVGSPLQISSALGNSPIVAGRFTGFGNLAYSALASAGLVVAVLAAHRLGRPWGRWVGVGALVAVVAVDGMPFWGSDVGGVLSMTPAYLVIAMLLLGWRLRLRTAMLVPLAAFVAVAGFGLLDLSRPSERRTHLGRLLEKIGDEGWSGFTTVIARKLEANLGNITNTVWVLVVPVALVFAAYLAFRAPGAVRDRLAGSGAIRAGLVGAALLVTLGFALNDSGVKVPGVMLVVLDAAVIVLLTSHPPDRARPVEAQP